MCVGWSGAVPQKEEMIATHKRLVTNRNRYQERGDRFMAERYQEDIDYLARTAKAFGITLDDEPAFKVQAPRVEVAKPVEAEKQRDLVTA